jgi:copper chaperone CopZ
VYEARASYAKGMVTVRYNPAQLQPKKLQEVIEELGYSVVVSA